MRGRLGRIALVVGSALVSGCGDGAGRPEALQERPEAVADTIEVIEVVLDEYVFGMPSTLPGGTFTMRVVNVGIEEHDLAFTRALGDSTVWQLPARLGPGERSVHTVSLEPGAYLAICDFAGHVGRGMIMDVTVGDPS